MFERDKHIHTHLSLPQVQRCS